MERQGWRRGDRFDAGKHLHDAMVPFGSLARCDRRRAISCVEVAGLECTLAKAISYGRPGAVLTAEDLREGLPVGLAADLDPEGGLSGTVSGWEVGPQGELTEVRVRWPDGTESLHVPEERELRRLEGGSS